MPAWLFVADDCFPRMHASAGRTEKQLEAAIVVFHRAIAQWAASGRNLIIDGALPYGDVALRTKCLDEFTEFRTSIISVSCNVEELRRREAQRPEPRLPGWAEQQHRDVNIGLPIAFHVDTTTITATEAAQELLDWLIGSGA